MLYPPSLERLVEALRCLPGVGPKSAQRMAFHLLERERAGGAEIAAALTQAFEKLGHCSRCRMYAEGELCPVCASTQRDRSMLCVVESPSDVVAIEQATDYRGRYFVLGGRLSPLDGIGPKEIGLDKLAERLAEGEIDEVILATNPTVEGEATAQYIGDMAAARKIVTSRIAHGVPLGGELEYIDGGTLAHAFSGRRNFNDRGNW